MYLHAIINDLNCFKITVINETISDERHYDMKNFVLKLSSVEYCRTVKVRATEP